MKFGIDIGCLMHQRVVLEYQIVLIIQGTVQKIVLTFDIMNDTEKMNYIKNNK